MNSESQGIGNWMQLLRQAYGFFRARFEEYFPLVLGPAIVAGAAYFGLEQLRLFLAMITNHHSLFDQPSASTYFRGWLVGWLLWCLEILVVWVAGTFTFACVAVKVLAAKGTSRERVPAAQAFRRATTQFRKLAGIALLGSLATTVFSSFLLPLLLRPLPYLFFYLRLPYENFLQAYSVARGLVFTIFGGLLCSMAPAVPTLIANPALSVRHAVRIVLRNTRAQLPFIAIWLSASAVCGGAAYYTVAEIVQAACIRGRTPALECSFFLMLLAVVVVSLFTGPVFIGLTVLSVEDNLKEEASLAAPAH